MTQGCGPFVSDGMSYMPLTELAQEEQRKYQKTSL